MHALRLAAFALALPLAVQAAVAETGTWHRFKRWDAGCDNARSCTTAAADSDRDSALAIALSRTGGRDAPLRIRFPLHFSMDAPRKGALTLAGTGGAPVVLRLGRDTGVEEGVLVVTAPAARDAIVRLLRRETELKAVFSPPLPGAERSDFTIPLDGAMAALLWIDEQQKRVGTVTALVRPGDRSATTIPPVPALPMRPKAAPLPRAEPAPTLSPAALARLDAIRGEGCEENVVEEGAGKPQVHPLGGGRLLVAYPCARYASSESSAYFIVQDGPSPVVEPARFPRPYESRHHEDPEPTPGHVLQDVYFEGFAKTGELSSGDGTQGGSFCGERAAWVWTGRSFEPETIRTLLPCGAAFVEVPLYRTR